MADFDTGPVDNFKSSIDDALRGIKALKAESDFKEMKDSFGKIRGSIESFKESLGPLNGKNQKLHQTLDKLQKKANSLSGKIDKLGDGSKTSAGKLRLIKSEIENVAGAASDSVKIVDDLSKSSTSLSKASKIAKGSVGDLASEIRNGGEAFKGFKGGAILAVGGSIAFARGLGSVGKAIRSSIKDLNQYQVSMEVTSKTSMVSPKGVAGLEQLRGVIGTTREEFAPFLSTLEAVGKKGIETDSLERAAKNVTALYGTGAPAQKALTEYANLLATMPSLEQDLKLGVESDDSAASLFALAKEGKVDVAIKAGLFGDIGESSEAANIQTDVQKSLQVEEDIKKYVADWLKLGHSYLPYLVGIGAAGGIAASALTTLVALESAGKVGGAIKSVGSKAISGLLPTLGKAGSFLGSQLSALGVTVGVAAAGIAGLAGAAYFLYDIFASWDDVDDQILATSESFRKMDAALNSSPEMSSNDYVGVQLDGLNAALEDSGKKVGAFSTAASETAGTIGGLALSGAALGGAIGTALLPIPVIGTAFGAAIGGAIGAVTGLTSAFIHSYSAAEKYKAKQEEMIRVAEEATKNFKDGSDVEDFRKSLQILSQANQKAVKERKNQIEVAKKFERSIQSLDAAAKSTVVSLYKMQKATASMSSKIMSDMGGSGAAFLDAVQSIHTSAKSTFGKRMRDIGKIIDRTKKELSGSPIEKNMALLNAENQQIAALQELASATKEAIDALSNSPKLLSYKLSGELSGMGQKLADVMGGGLNLKDMTSNFESQINAFGSEMEEAGKIGSEKIKIAINALKDQLKFDAEKKEKTKKDVEGISDKDLEEAFGKENVKLAKKLKEGTASKEELSKLQEISKGIEEKERERGEKASELKKLITDDIKNVLGGGELGRMQREEKEIGDKGYLLKGYKQYRKRGLEQGQDSWYDSAVEDDFQDWQEEESGGDKRREEKIWGIHVNTSNIDEAIASNEKAAEKQATKRANLKTKLTNIEVMDVGATGLKGDDAEKFTKMKEALSAKREEKGGDLKLEDQVAAIQGIIGKSSDISSFLTKIESSSGNAIKESSKNLDIAQKVLNAAKAKSSSAEGKTKLLLETMQKAVNGIVDSAGRAVESFDKFLNTKSGEFKKAEALSKQFDALESAGDIGLPYELIGEAIQSDIDVYKESSKMAENIAKNAPKFAKTITDSLSKSFEELGISQESSIEDIEKAFSDDIKSSEGYKKSSESEKRSIDESVKDAAIRFKQAGTLDPEEIVDIFKINAVTKQIEIQGKSFGAALKRIDNSVKNAAKMKGAEKIISSVDEMMKLAEFGGIDTKKQADIAMSAAKEKAKVEASGYKDAIQKNKDLIKLTEKSIDAEEAKGGDADIKEIKRLQALIDNAAGSLFSNEQKLASIRQRLSQENLKQIIAATALEMKRSQIAQEASQTQLDLLEQIGAPFSLILEKQVEIVNQAKIQAEIESQRLKEMEADKVSGVALEEQKLKVIKAQADVTKKTVQAQKSSMEKLLGTAMSQLESIGGFKRNLLSQQKGTGLVVGPGGIVQGGKGSAVSKSQQAASIHAGLMVGGSSAGFSSFTRTEMLTKKASKDQAKRDKIRDNKLDSIDSKIGRVFGTRQPTNKMINANMGKVGNFVNTNADRQEITKKQVDAARKEKGKVPIASYNRRGIKRDPFDPFADNSIEGRLIRQNMEKHKKDKKLLRDDPKAYDKKKRKEKQREINWAQINDPEEYKRLIAERKREDSFRPSANTWGKTETSKKIQDTLDKQKKIRQEKEAKENKISARMNQMINDRGPGGSILSGAGLREAAIKDLNDPKSKYNIADREAARKKDSLMLAAEQAQHKALDQEQIDAQRRTDAAIKAFDELQNKKWEEQNEKEKKADEDRKKLNEERKKEAARSEELLSQISKKLDVLDVNVV